MHIEGALAAALVDMSSSSIIGDLGSANFDVRAAALGNVQVVRAKYAVVQHLELKEQIEDILAFLILTVSIRLTYIKINLAKQQKQQRTVVRQKRRNKQE